MGSIFVEFANIRHALTAIKKVRGRIYDNREIKTIFVDDILYISYFFPEMMKNLKSKLEKFTEN